MELGEFLRESVTLLTAAVVVGVVSARLRLPPLIGLMLTGLLIGPHGLGWVREVEQVELFAEIGVVLLLFLIGLELDLGQMRRLLRPMLAGGGLQVLLTMALVGTACLAATGQWRLSTFVAMASALSSTAVVLRIYGERRETGTTNGRLVLAVLLFQDLLIVPMIVLTPVLAGGETTTGGELVVRFLGSLLVVGAVFVGARFVMPVLLHQIARLGAREIFLLGALAVCLALSWLTYSFGFSLALGAFVAGILVSETEYSHQMVADLMPFRDVFASLFFISIGMLVDLPASLDRLPLVLPLALLLIVVKGLAAAAGIRWAGYSGRVALVSGLALAQIGEFSFVLMEVGRESGLLAADGFQTLLLVAVLTLLATPFVIRAAPALADRLLARPPSTEATPRDRLSGHVLVVGYGDSGGLLCRVLSEALVPYVVVDMDAANVRAAKARGVPILYGDVSRPEILGTAGVESAKVVVFAIADPYVVSRAVRHTRRLNEHCEVVVRTRSIREIEALRAAGAQEVIAETFEAAIAIFTHVLAQYHVPGNVIRAQQRVLRGEGYRLLRSQSSSGALSDRLMEVLAGGTTEVFLVRAESRAAGRSLRELDLRGRTGASVIAIVRGGESLTNPSADLPLQGDDRLVLVGSHAEIDQAFDHLERPTG